MEAYKFDWKIKEARNGDLTLLLNNHRVYSMYNPIKDANDWINNEVEANSIGYFLIGLGLGYHLIALSKKFPNKKIFVLYFNDEELKIFKDNNKDNWWVADNISIIKSPPDEVINSREIQLLLPNVWLKAIDKNFPVLRILESIKIQQISYKKNKTLLIDNFSKNILLNDFSRPSIKNPNSAVLVSAGPSLDETVNWLKMIPENIEIFAVGAALKTLLNNRIQPKYIILSDANENTKQQFENADYSGELLYLSTANHECVKLFSNKRYILFQEGYEKAEKKAEELGLNTIETGGSVATTAFSLIEKLGYKSLFLFGQDLGFYGNSSHAKDSVSKRSVEKDIFSKKIISNDGTIINTNSMFQAFHVWFDMKCEKTIMKVYNTAKKGAKISNVPLISEEEFYKIIKSDV